MVASGGREEKVDWAAETGRTLPRDDPSARTLPASDYRVSTTDSSCQSTPTCCRDTFERSPPLLDQFSSRCERVPKGPLLGPRFFFSRSVVILASDPAMMARRRAT
ncbi:uncharacterized protein LOC143178953 [Calliopsis andreniformis]|uniref:uncharacterized protein LOC143178953 n=1 Tax=Calliopsis andreniformis TaxID=337506 RepID=UPI003FCE7308